MGVCRRGGGRYGSHWRGRAESLLNTHISLKKIRHGKYDPQHRSQKIQRICMREGISAGEEAEISFYDGPSSSFHPYDQRKEEKDVSK